MSATSPAGSTGTPAPCGDWQVDPPLPADRGLVARLLEECVRTDPTVARLAPGVADGSQRAGAWLAGTRPAWSGVVVEPGHSPRRLLGYADVLAAPADAVSGSSPGHRLRLLLLVPAASGTAVAALLRAAAEEAVAALDAAATTAAAAGPFPDEDGTPPTRFAVPVPVRRRPVAALAGAAAIVLGGVAAVLVVQVGVGPLGGVLPFLAPDGPASTSSTDPDPASGGPDDPPAAVPAQPVADAGAPIAPLPAPEPGTGPDVDGGEPEVPLGPPAPPPGPPPAPPGDRPGLTSSLVDPVVSTVVTVVDAATGDAVAPVTSLVEGITDGTTDLLDQTLEGVLGLLPPQQQR